MIIQWKWETDSRIKSDKVPEELWMEVRDTVQETGIKIIPKKKKCKKAKWLSEEALQITVKSSYEPWTSRCSSGFRKGRGTRDQIANIRWIMEKQESSRKTSISPLLTMPKPLTVWITRNCGKFWKRWEYQTTWPPSWGICMQVRKQQLELDMEW